MKKIALITGVTGQDGSYLAEFLLNKGYEVHGIKRRSSLFNTARIDHIFQDAHIPGRNFIHHYGDMTDSSSLSRILEEVEPTEIYNLAAQSHVRVSFDTPEYTANSDAMGTLRLLEAIRNLNKFEEVKFYQASTSELYGLVQEIPQKESTPFYPRSPYAAAKLYAYWITVNYREAYNMFACNGILFNHESPRRGETFVTRKITRGLANISLGNENCLYMGNIDALRDWGHAKDYVEAMWLMLQQDKPEDLVIATGIQHSVRQFILWTASTLGMEIVWEGDGLNEIGYWVNASSEVENKIKENSKEENNLNGKIPIIKIDPSYFRPTEVETLLGDPSKAKNLLGWQPKITAEEMCEEMTLYDLQEAKKSLFLKENKF